MKYIAIYKFNGLNPSPQFNMKLFTQEDDPIQAKILLLGPLVLIELGGIVSSCVSILKGISSVLGVGESWGSRVGGSPVDEVEGVVCFNKVSIRY